MSTPTAESSTRHAWWIAPLTLLAAGASAWIALAHPAWLFGVVATIVVGAGILWIVVSALSPSKADRTCPSCGARALERVDALSTQGVTCSACGHTDPTMSTFYMAEEEGPIEPIALARRRADGETRERMSHTAGRG